MQIYKEHFLPNPNSIGGAAVECDAEPIRTQNLDPSDKVQSTSTQSEDKKQANKQRSRTIPVEIKRAAYHRDKGKCQYTDPITGKKCLSSRAIQYEHLVQFAAGGETSVLNLRICCSLHNKILAIEYYGTNKMAAYLDIG